MNEDLENTVRLMELFNAATRRKKTRLQEQVHDSIIYANSLCHEELQKGNVGRGGLPEGLVDRLRKKNCGECSLCCVSPAIDANTLGPDIHILQPKPACTACMHSSESGCAIYDKRPHICKSYMCLYATGAVDHRPDENKVCWTLQEDMTGVAVSVLVGHAMDTYAAVKNRKERKLIREILGLDYISGAAIRDDKNMVWFGANGETREASVDPSDPMRTRPDAASERHSTLRHPMYDIEHVCK